MARSRSSAATAIARVWLLFAVAGLVGNLGRSHPGAGAAATAGVEVAWFALAGVAYWVVSPADAHRGRRSLRSVPLAMLRSMIQTKPRRRASSPSYQASRDAAQLPSFVRRAQGLPDCHDERQWVNGQWRG